jgi:hypothetical protein
MIISGGSCGVGLVAWLGSCCEVGSGTTTEGHGAAGGIEGVEVRRLVAGSGVGAGASALVAAAGVVGLEDVADVVVLGVRLVLRGNARVMSLVAARRAISWALVGCSVVEMKWRVMRAS